MRAEVAILEFGRIVRGAVGIEAVLGIERIELGDRRRVRGIVLVGDRRIDAAQEVHGVARMRVGEDHAVDRRQLRQLVAALHDLVLALAVVRAFLRHGLVEAHDRPAAGIADQQHLGDARLLAQELDPHLHVERQPLEVDVRLVVLVARVHAQHQEATPRQLRAGAVRQVVRRAVHDDDADMRRRTAVGLVEHRLGAAGEGQEFGMALRGGRSACETQRRRRGERGLKPEPPHGFSPCLVLDRASLAVSNGRGKASDPDLPKPGYAVARIAQME
jgi:hypothetical protein